MTKLTTHVLDIYSGKPGKGIKVELFYINGDERSKLKTIVLNSDGRSDEPLVEMENFKNGKYSCVVKKCMGAILTNMAILSRGN